MGSSVDKVVIMARGLGTRMRRAATGDLVARQAAVADTGVKALIPIDRPFLDYVLTAVAAAGYSRVCLVVGPEQQALRDYYGQVAARRLAFSFATQPEPKGTADAVLAAQDFAAGDPFVVLNSDNYYPAEALAALRSSSGAATALFDWQKMLEGSNLSAERLRQFAVGVADADGYLERILEKPDGPTWDRLRHPILISMNCWRFEPWIFASCKAIRPSPRGELEIPDAVQHAMAAGHRFRVLPVAAPVLDLSSRQDIGPVTARLAGTEVQL
jgi:dTDP-glucose pyrophosphorylase